MIILRGIDEILDEIDLIDKGMIFLRVRFKSKNTFLDRVVPKFFEGLELFLFWKNSFFEMIFDILIIFNGLIDPIQEAFLGLAGIVDGVDGGLVHGIVRLNGFKIIPGFKAMVIRASVLDKRSGFIHSVI